jgi:hypothetical protein
MQKMYNKEPHNYSGQVKEDPMARACRAQEW